MNSEEETISTRENIEAETAENTYGLSERSPANDFLIVGIGASAGGFEAIQVFLKKIPANSGMAFILVPHLDPTRETMMPELLSHITTMPVNLVQDYTKVEPDHVYIISPNKTLTIEKNILRLSVPQQTRGLRLPIDAFFKSLGENQKQNAVAVILSGTGADGTIGLKIVKEHGGAVFAQNLESAKYEGMPQSAILTGLVDFILPIEEIPERLIEYNKNRELLQHSIGDNSFHAEMLNLLDEICLLLRRKTGHDFSNYKKNTLIRRIQRQMQIEQIISVGKYVEALRADERRITELFKDLLIGVTYFFRDREAFEALGAMAISKIVESKGKDTENGGIRVWVPACATGEEAYTIAMLISDYCDRHNVRIPAQIFATDIDEDALDTARAARYPDSIAEQVPEYFLEKYFIKQGNVYQIKKSIREMCLFSPHNLIKDPPFSRLDLISCRNLLIYLDGELQKRILPMFHYSLNAEAFLFLGSSESFGVYSDLFRVLDKSYRIYQAKITPVASRTSLPSSNANRYDRTYMRSKTGLEKRPPEIGSVVENILLKTYAPTCAIVNDRGEAAYFFGRTGKYFEPSAGAPSNNILDMARRGLRLDLRTALHKAAAGNEQIIHENVTVETENHVQKIKLTVRPLTEFSQDSNLFLVVIEDVGESVTQKEIAAAGVKFQDSENPLVQQLEIELRATKEHLQTTIEELETSNEELKSSNEELLSMNEEMQSSNEELQTSKEEMQSINEELETVNAELRKKIEEVDAANSDLQNLFQSTNIATVFLDRKLRIKRYTPATNEIFRLIETDLGRPITDITARFDGGNLADDVRKVLETLKTVEREIRLSGGEGYFVLRINPYRTIDNVIEGVALTFTDISEIRQSRTHAEERARQQSAIAELGLFSLQTNDILAICQKATKLAQDILKTDYTKILEVLPGGKELILVSGEGWRDGLIGVGTVGADLDSQAGYTLANNSPVIVEDLRTETRFHGSQLLLDDGVISGMSVVIYGTNKHYGVFGVHTKTEREFNRAEADFLQSFANIVAAAIQRENNLAALLESKEQLRRNHETFFDLVQNTPFGIYIVNSNFQMSQISAGSQKVFSNVNPLIGRDFGEIMRTVWEEPFASEVIGHFRRTLETGEPYIAGSFTERRGDVENIESYDWKIERIVLPDDTFGVVCYFYDLTELRSTEEALRESEEKFRAMAESVPNMIFTISADGKTDYINERFLNFIGIKREEISNIDLGAFVHPEDIEETRRIWSETADNRAVFQHSYRFRRNDGEYHWFIGRAVPILGDNDEILRWFGALTEIEEIVRAKNEIEEADRRKNEFLAMLGHELRNPLAPIVNSLRILEKDTTPAQSKDMLEIIERQVGQMARLVDDLLDVSRISHGKIQLRQTPVNLNSVIEHVEKDFARTMENNNLRLETQIPENPVWVEADEARLTQTIGNLIGNAIKFSKSEGQIEIALSTENAQAVIKVKDDGIGMNAEVLERIFDTFSQEDRSLDRSRGGLGLGLPVAKGLIELHGGTISAKSTGENQGSEFTIRLPLGKFPVESPAEEKPKLQTAKTSPRRILIIEDNLDSAESLRMLLSLDDHSVEVAHDGQSGLTKAESFAPEIIICDIGLPGAFDGYQVAEKIRADENLRDVYLIALSGYGQADDLEHSQHIGFNRHLTKPADFDVLLGLINDFENDN